jgi:soluble lytic murein transglycosylase-like protein
MAVPRVHLPGGSSVIGFPQPLAPSEAARVRKIFALQRQDNIPAAVAETARLTDTTLLGHILADRLLARPARAAAPALTEWLGRYADLPDACAIYALLLKRLPAGAHAPPPPAAATLGTHAAALAHASDGLAGPARAALVQGRDTQAQRLGREAFERSHGRDGEAAFVAGLAAWRRGANDDAAALFDSASVSEGAGAGLRAAAAFWAARAYERLGQSRAWRAWMTRAASEPHTLHGILARRVLGLVTSGAPIRPTLAEADVEAVAARPAGLRAFALLQVGEPARAEAELRLLWPAAQGNAPLLRALFLVAGAAGLNDLVADLSGVVDATPADLPVPILRPAGGYRLEPALVYAVAHVESNFDEHAISSAGAHGLMQLRPVAADAVSGIAGSAGPAGRLLQNPGQNLRVGQAFLAFLARPEFAGDDLLRVLASYNSGPYAVRGWTHAQDGDPLMFIETIPNTQTRQFVQRTLRNLWAYAARFAQPSPSLEAMAAGQLPRFTPEILPVPQVVRRASLASLH